MLTHCRPPPAGPPWADDVRPALFLPPPLRSLSRFLPATAVALSHGCLKGARGRSSCSSPPHTSTAPLDTNWGHVRLDQAGVMCRAVILFFKSAGAGGPSRDRGCDKSLIGVYGMASGCAPPDPLTSRAINVLAVEGTTTVLIDPLRLRPEEKLKPLIPHSRCGAQSPPKRFLSGLPFPPGESAGTSRGMPGTQGGTSHQLGSWTTPTTHAPRSCTSRGIRVNSAFCPRRLDQGFCGTSCTPSARSSDAPPREETRNQQDRIPRLRTPPALPRLRPSDRDPHPGAHHGIGPF